MKVLFLDIDGVLNKRGTKEKYKEFTGVDQKLLDRYLTWYNQRKEDVSVVLSSTWRRDEEAKKYLRDLGLSWSSETPFLNHVRTSEICSWLIDNYCKSNYLAILDDDSIKAPLHKHHVAVSPIYGLRNKDLIKANKLLGYDPIKTPTR